MSQYKSFNAHFPSKISEDLVEFVTNSVLLESRYLFFKTILGLQYAHCTHCNKHHRSEIKLKHKQEQKVICPNCRSSCKVRAAGISRKYMTDKAVLVWYEKSVANSEAITARVIEVRRDYSVTYENVQTMYNVSHMYLFEPGKSEHWNYRSKCKTAYSGFDKSYGSGSWVRFVSLDNILQAVKDTPFQYSTWEGYTKFDNIYYVSDMVEFFDLAARYPCVEYLTKLGFSKIIRNRMHGASTMNAINWRGKTIEKVLRLDKSDIRDLRTCGLEYGPSELLYLQRIRRQGKTYTAWEAYYLSRIDTEYYASSIFEATSAYASKDEVRAYLLKQFQRKQSRGITTVASDYRDYLHQCEELGMSIAERRYLFPNNLHEAHQKATKKVKYKKDKELNMKIEGLYLKLQKQYFFQTDNFLIRPIKNATEIFNEAKSLSHCVGSYAGRHAAGEVAILVVRRKTEPDVPFYTAEIDGKTIRQCRGLKNCAMTDDVDKFISDFAESKLKKQPGKHMRGVAV